MIPKQELKQIIKDMLQEQRRVGEYTPYTRNLAQHWSDTSGAYRDKKRKQRGRRNAAIRRKNMKVCGQEDRCTREQYDDYDIAQAEKIKARRRGDERFRKTAGEYIGKGADWLEQQWNKAGVQDFVGDDPAAATTGGSGWGFDDEEVTGGQSLPPGVSDQPPPQTQTPAPQMTPASPSDLASPPPPIAGSGWDQEPGITGGQSLPPGMSGEAEPQTQTPAPQMTPASPSDLAKPRAKKGFSRAQERMRRKINRLKKQGKISKADWRKARKALYRGPGAAQMVLVGALGGGSKGVAGALGIPSKGAGSDITKPPVAAGPRLEENIVYSSFPDQHKLFESWKKFVKTSKE